MRVLVCGHALTTGTLGETAEDETPSKMCWRPATFEIGRPGVRPKYRCDEHAEPYRALSLLDGFGDMWFNQVSA